MRSRQANLFDDRPDGVSEASSVGPFGQCRIGAVGKRRDGGTKYWCFEHHADATAKYGRPASHCRYAHVTRPTSSETLFLKECDFPGGVALWGAVPPVYDTTSEKLDRGIHVHARTSLGASKAIDETYRKVVYQPLEGCSKPIEIFELDAIYFMVSSVFGFSTRYVECTLCGHPHLDRDWFSVHEHGKHLCAACGRTFRDTRVSVGNPLASIASKHGGRSRARPAARTVQICQRDFPGGIQLWGSNPAIVWTGDGVEETGIHLHAYADCDGNDPVIDDTFNSVTIDGLFIDQEQVRIFMAQSALPHLSGRVVSARCANCKTLHFDGGVGGFTPSKSRSCAICRGPIQADGRLRNIIANPIVDQLARLEKTSTRRRVLHNLALIPETI